MGFLLSLISPSMNCSLSIPTVWLTLRSILVDVLLFNRIKLEIVLFWYSQHFLLTYRGVFSALMSSLSFIPSTIRMLSSVSASVVLFVLCSFIIFSKKEHSITPPYKASCTNHLIDSLVLHRQPIKSLLMSHRFFYHSIVKIDIGRRLE